GKPFRARCGRKGKLEKSLSNEPWRCQWRAADFFLNSRGRPESEHAHGLADHDFDALFTTDRPILSNFHSGATKSQLESRPFLPSPRCSPSPSTTSSSNRCTRTRAWKCSPFGRGNCSRPW